MTMKDRDKAERLATLTTGQAHAPVLGAAAQAESAPTTPRAWLGESFNEADPQECPMRIQQHEIKRYKGQLEWDECLITTGFKKHEQQLGAIGREGKHFSARAG